MTEKTEGSWNLGQICTFQVWRLKLLPKGVENTCRQRSSRSWLSLKSAMSGLKKKNSRKPEWGEGEDCSEIRVSSVPTSRQGTVGGFGGGGEMSRDSKILASGQWFSNRDPVSGKIPGRLPVLEERLPGHTRQVISIFQKLSEVNKC